MNESDPLRGTAIHEAAHVVIAKWVGAEHVTATIIPDGDRLGVGKIRARPQHLFADIVTRMAGWIAELEVFGDYSPGALGDARKVNATLRRFAQDTQADVPLVFVVDLKLRLYRHSRGLVRKHRKTIELVADALLERGTLACDEVDELMPLIKARGRFGHRR